MKHIVEYAALVAVVSFVRILPYRAALFVGWLLALLAFYVVRFRVAEAQQRIREVFGDRFSDKEVRHIAWISLRNMCFNVVEIMRMASVTRKWAEKVIDHQQVYRVEKECKPGQGAVFALLHMGSWDMAGVAAAAFGVPIFFLTGVQRNPLVDGYLNKMRSISGAEAIPRDGGMLRKVIKNLKQGKVLGFNTDLRSRTQALSIHFLGKEANIVGGMAMFARQADALIFPVIVTRIGWARHKWVFHDPLSVDREGDKEEAWRKTTQDVMDIFDAAIREQPEQYFWYNKRWILDPLKEV